MIELSRRQPSFGAGLIAAEVGDLWEDWMRQVDHLLDDAQLLQLVFDALAQRWPHSLTRGRRGTTAEVVLRLLVLKHMRNWSYAALEREVRANLVYRQFSRVGAGKVPDAKTMGRLGLALGPKVVEQIHRRVVALALEHSVVEGRRMRVDTTVVETSIHYPTDGALLGDGVRVLVYDERPADAALLIPAIELHVQQFGKPPRLATADAGFFSAHNEAAAKNLGVKRVSIPNLSSKSADRKKLQKTRWFRQAQKWRTGCEGRISLLKRRHGLNRCRYKGPEGMRRWVGLGIVADNLINIGLAMARQAADPR